MSNREIVVVQWDKAKLAKFKAAYERAKLNPLTDVFQFEGHDFVLGYAKYLIEYLESHLTGNNE